MAEFPERGISEKELWTEVMHLDNLRSNAWDAYEVHLSRAEEIKGSIEGAATPGQLEIISQNDRAYWEATHRVIDAATRLAQTYSLFQRHFPNSSLPREYPGFVGMMEDMEEWLTEANRICINAECRAYEMLKGLMLARGKH